jgi:hypothetical protein
MILMKLIVGSHSTVTGAENPLGWRIRDFPPAE